MRIKSAFLPSLFVFLSLFVAPVFAQQEAAAKPQEQAAATEPQDELEVAFAAAKVTMKAGPADIPLRDQAVLKLSDQFIFIPEKEAAQVLRAWGNRVGGDGLLGMIFPAGEGDWFAVVQYEASGYIKDDDAKDWDADELLQSLKDGTEGSNEERRARGIAEMEVVGWVEQPTYDAPNHRLVWSLSSKDKGAAESAELGINYNTYALGREGYVSINLVTSMGVIEAQKPMAKALLASLEYNEGKRYTDFDSSTDKVATYGLAALVGGVAAKKLGLLAVIAAFALKFAKVIGVAVIGLGAFIFKRRKDKKETQEQAKDEAKDPTNDEAKDETKEQAKHQA